MKFFIREWSKKTIVLMTEAGHVLAYFSSINDALDACDQWYCKNTSEQRLNVTIQYREDLAQASIAEVA